mmetsp:Transcript_100925/g.174329  ORF Transcript_100925/g.174329 Transcript_100925/m.174329 type:complete len:266 (+) Transcript_100925:389-1186(+)
MLLRLETSHHLACLPIRQRRGFPRLDRLLQILQSRVPGADPVPDQQHAGQQVGLLPGHHRQPAGGQELPAVAPGFLLPDGGDGLLPRDGGLQPLALLRAALQQYCNGRQLHRPTEDALQRPSPQGVGPAGLEPDVVQDVPVGGPRAPGAAGQPIPVVLGLHPAWRRARGARDPSQEHQRLPVPVGVAAPPHHDEAGCEGLPLLRSLRVPHHHLPRVGVQQLRPLQLHPAVLHVLLPAGRGHARALRGNPGPALGPELPQQPQEVV